MIQQTSTPPRTGAVEAPASRWLEVVSHLDPKYGGLSSAVPALGRRVAQTGGFDVSIAGFCNSDEHFQPSGYDSGHLSYWPASRGPWIKDRFSGHSLANALQLQIAQADGVHIHGLWEQSTALAASSARKLRKPYILSAHGMLEPWALASKRVKKFVYGHLVERTNVAQATCLHALTHAEARYFQRFGARSPIAIIPNGVDIPEDRNADPFLELFPFLKGKRIVLFLARLHPKKGLDLLLEAWTAVASQFPDAHLVLAGPDSEGTQARLEYHIATRNLGHSVVITGMLRDALKWSAFAASEAFVLPSFSEGLSVSVLEAMGMSLPVIVTEPCNMPEVVSFKTGWQIQPSVSELTSALSELLNNSSAQNHALGGRAADLIHTRYTWPIVATQMAEVYRWVTGGPKPSSVEIVFPV